MKCILMGLLFLIVSCGKTSIDGGAASSSSAFQATGACASSPFIGQWKSNITNMILELNGACQYINNFCGSSGSFPPNIITSNGQILITVTSRGATAPSNCPQLGVNQCSFAVNTSVSPNQLGVQCGSATGYYTKQ